MADTSTIANLLSSLARNNKVSSWKMNCCYADGLGKSYHEISLYLKADKLKKIRFEMESGKVVTCEYKSSSSESEDIVDLLLDLFNEENKYNQ